MSAVVSTVVPGLPEIAAGAPLAQEVARAVAAAGLAIGCETVVSIAHKVVSKSEGAVALLAEVVPSVRAIELAGTLGRADPRQIQVILDESAEVVRAADGVLICRTHHGFVCANAGVDASNALPGTLVKLPRDPDASARRLRADLHALCGARPAVIVTDSFGRAWRNGQCDVAIGCAGLAPLDDWRGRTDSLGRRLHATCLAVADLAAAAADLARSKDASEPVVLVTGLQRHITDEDGPGAQALVRRAERDLFR